MHNKPSGATSSPPGEESTPAETDSLQPTTIPSDSPLAEQEPPGSTIDPLGATALLGSEIVVCGQADGPENHANSDETESKLPITAHQGMVELLDAKWELSKGRTVKFRLMDDPNQPYTAHPFAQFSRRRGNRPGTRFRAAFARYGEDRAYFEGELMLLSGGNPLGQGMWVSFWLDDEGVDHPFAGCSGRSGDHPGDLFYVIFVELDDDDYPIDQEKRKRLEDVRGGRRGGALARLAGQWCSNEMFLQWLSETVKVGDQPSSRPASWWRADDHAARWIRWVCGVESRADIDHNDAAANIFHEKIRIPFRDWSDTSED